MSIMKEFRDFALRGNVLDLAVGVIIGAAFGRIISSFVDDILMPPLGLLLGGVDFANLFVALDGGTYATLAEAQAAGAPTLNYGLFLNNVVDFLLVALAIFLLIRWVNRLMRQPAKEEAPATKLCPYCFSGIPTQATRCPNCTSELPAPAPAAT